MRILFAFLLIFTVFSDFTSASVFEESASHSESQVSCEDVDLHSSEDSHEDHDHNDHHCHSGHSHTVVIMSETIDLKPVLISLNSACYFYQVGSPKTIISTIVRPPIA